MPFPPTPWPYSFFQRHSFKKLIQPLESSGGGFLKPEDTTWPSMFGTTFAPSNLLEGSALKPYDSPCKVGLEDDEQSIFAVGFFFYK